MQALIIAVNLIDGIIESFCASYFIITILNLIDKSKNSTFENIKRFLHFWLFTLTALIINKAIHVYLPDLKWLKFIIFIAIVSFGSTKCYRVNIFKSIIACILTSIVMAVLEVIGVLILLGVNIDPANVVSNLYYNCIYASTVAIAYALIAYVINKINVLYHTNLAGVENKLKYFLPQLIAIIICLFPTMILLMLNDFKYSFVFIVVNVIQLLAVGFVGIYNLRFVAKHEDTEMQLENTIIYNETLSKVNEGVRGFKHDMGNIVQAILGYIAINDAEGAKEYCNNLVIGFNDINVLSILSPKVIDDPAIYGVIVNKILIAREKNMTLSLDITADIAEINFPKFELSRIIGILIDNAIEAGENTEDKKLIVDIRHDYIKNTDIIVISNSIDNTNIDTNKIFEKNYSTKENPSGFGLYEVKKFIKQNPQSAIKTTINDRDHLFTQSITINCKQCLDIQKESTVA